MIPKPMTYIPKVIEYTDTNQIYIESNRKWSYPTNYPTTVDNTVKKKLFNISEEEEIQPVDSSNISKIFMNPELYLDQARLYLIEVKGDSTR